MPTVAGELRTSTETVDGCAELTAFSCGDGRIDAERTVDRIIESYAVGTVPLPTLRVTREFPSRDLVGLVAIENEGIGYNHPLFQMPDWVDPLYISVLTLSAKYRGGFAAQDSTPLSHVLLRDALGFVASEAEGGEVPSMQAVIGADNHQSRSLFEAHGFEMIPTAPELLYVRPRGLAIPGGGAE